ncbi:hypothetical protein VTO73DRAFT_6099 [Trametes versicolor]
MPATRTESKQAGRSATHHFPGSVDKAAVERKTARQRAKQKARAPLPPSSEIIEISSDDDEPPAKRRSSGSMTALERRVKELEEENKKCKQAVLASQAALQARAPLSSNPLAKEGAPVPDVKFDKFLSTIDEHVSCEICTTKMWNPYTLACGHTFCKDCLQDWFSTTLAQHMAAHPHYNPQVVVPPHWRAALARPNLSPLDRRHIEREIQRHAEATPQPAYSCPTCRVEVRNKPAENFIVKHMVRTIAGAQGESCPKDNAPPRLVGQVVEGPWDAFFPFAFGFS